MIDDGVSTLAHLLALRDADKNATTVAFASQKAAIDAALTAAERAVLKAEAATEKRFESVNEFRAALGDQQRLFMPRAETVVLLEAMSARLARIEDLSKSGQAERAGIKGGWGYAVGAAGFAMFIVSFVLTLLKP